MRDPTLISSINLGIKAAIPIFFVVRILINPTVKKIAIGSLLPDSSSSSGFKGCFRLIRLDLKMLNTAAASVEETMEPSSIPSKRENFRIWTAKNPVMIAVIKTPAVERMTPGKIIDLVSFQLVSRPPEKIIKMRATMPMDLANCASSK